jgi:hypothetical protein
MRWLGFVSFLAACSLSAQTSVVPEIQYRSVAQFLAPAKRSLFWRSYRRRGEFRKATSSCFLAAIHLVPRMVQPRRSCWSSALMGNFSEIGHNLYAWSYAHTVKIDPQDNI